MATYADIRRLFGNTDLRHKVEVAVAVAAHGIIAGESPTANQLAWARSVLSSPKPEAEKLLIYILAASKAASLATIMGATDDTIQAKVDEAVAALYA